MSHKPWQPICVMLLNLFQKPFSALNWISLNIFQMTNCFPFFTSQSSHTHSLVYSVDNGFEIYSAFLVLCFHSWKKKYVSVCEKCHQFYILKLKIGIKWRKWLKFVLNLWNFISQLFSSGFSHLKQQAEKWKQLNP